MTVVASPRPPVAHSRLAAERARLQFTNGAVMMQAMAPRFEGEMEQLRAIFQSKGAYFLILDRDERVVLVNEPLRSLRGYGDRDMAGSPYRAHSHAALGPEIVERWQAASGPERLEPVEYEGKSIDAAGKPRIIKTTATPVQDDSGRLRYIVLIGVDDTHRRQAEIRLFDSARLANLGEMASGIAHEINQPLAVIRMAAESLREELDDPRAEADPATLLAYARAKLDRIMGQTERAADIIRELRTVTRKPTNDSRPFNLADVARASAVLLQEQLRALRIDLVLHLPSDSGPFALGEASRLQQVVMNMTLNARDAILERADAAPQGAIGRIDLRVTQDVAAGQAVFAIEDDGPGLPESVRARLFEPFFTTKPPGKGTGLGLSIGYDIVRRIGGEISAENRLEGGARFRIGLPMVASETSDTVPVEQEACALRQVAPANY